MPIEQLEFTSSSLHYTFLEQSGLIDTEVDGLRVREIHIPSTRPGTRQNVGDYSVVISSPVQSREQLQDRVSAIEALARRLDEAWPYATSLPLILADRPWIQVGDPPGWTSNRREVDRRLSSSDGFFAEMTVESYRWMQLPGPPLGTALVAAEGIPKLSNPVAGLHRLFVASLKPADSEVRLFLRAKCLEIVRALLPGKTDSDKEKALPQKVQTSISRSLHDLFRLSNNRCDTRHPIDKKGQLHPAMTTEEANEFLADGASLIRGFMCNQLGIEPFVVERARSGS